MVLKKNEEENTKAEKYISPNITIVYCFASDIITASRETGGQWPWGTEQTGLFE